MPSLGSVNELELFHVHGGGPHEIVVITTSSKESAHGELEIVHRKVAVPGTANPVTPEVGELGVVMVAVPETTLHAPVPAVGVFPDKVAVVTPQAGFISVPALAVVGVHIQPKVTQVEEEAYHASKHSVVVLKMSKDVGIGAVMALRCVVVRRGMSKPLL